LTRAVDAESGGKTLNQSASRMGQRRYTSVLFSFFGDNFDYSRNMRNSIERLFAAITAAQLRDPAESRTAQLLQSGRAKIAKKLAEEAIEVVIDAIQGPPDAVTRESADLVYHLVVLWVASGVRPADVWNEMARRERLFGIAEKLPKHAAKGTALPGGRKVVTLAARRARKH
jgi:phosphoribosyl-ATP pyrophosphohydrolase